MIVVLFIKKPCSTLCKVFCYLRFLNFIILNTFVYNGYTCYFIVNELITFRGPETVNISYEIE